MRLRNSPWIYVQATLCVAALGVFGSTNTRLSSSASVRLQVAPQVSAHLQFLQEFSGADDVRKGLPPAVDRTLNIIAGPADPHAGVDRLVGPSEITTDSAHRIFVADPDTQTVQIFDFEDGKYSILGGQGSKLRSPGGFAIDRDDHIYVTDTVLGAIAVYDAKGKFQRYLGKVGNESYFQYPRGIAFQKETGDIYVCDSRRHMVVRLDKQGHILGHFGKRWGGKGAGDFRYPSQIVIAGEELLVLDSGNSRLQILDLDGHYRREIRFPEVSLDAGLALDELKNIYVSDVQLNVINVYSYDGQFLYRFGRAGTKPGEFSEPTGLWIDTFHKLYVADRKNRRVQVFAIERKE